MISCQVCHLSDSGVVALFHYFVLKPSISLRIFSKFPDSVIMHTLLFCLNFFKEYTSAFIQFCHPKAHLYLYYRNAKWNYSGNSRLGSVSAGSDWKQSSRDNFFVSIPVYYLFVIHYFSPAEIVFKKHMLISAHEWSFHIVQQYEDLPVYCYQISKYLQIFQIF